MSLSFITRRNIAFHTSDRMKRLRIASLSAWLMAITLGILSLCATAQADLVYVLVVAALVGGGAVVAWRAYKQGKPSALPASSNPDVNLDVGEVVQVAAWDAEGHASVKYRGANWQVTLAPGFPAMPGAFTITEVMGNRLIVKPN